MPCFSPWIQFVQNWKGYLNFGFFRFQARNPLLFRTNSTISLRIASLRCRPFQPFLSSFRFLIRLADPYLSFPACPPPTDNELIFDFNDFKIAQIDLIDVHTSSFLLYIRAIYNAPRPVPFSRIRKAPKCKATFSSIFGTFLTHPEKPRISRWTFTLTTLPVPYENLFDQCFFPSKKKRPEWIENLSVLDALRIIRSEDYTGRKADKRSCERSDHL